MGKDNYLLYFELNCEDDPSEVLILPFYCKLTFDLLVRTYSLPHNVQFKLRNIIMQQRLYKFDKSCIPTQLQQ